HAVRAEERYLHGGGEGGDQQCVAVGVADVRAGGAHGVVGAEDIDLEGLGQDGRVAAEERELPGDTRVGHDDVQAAQLAGEGGDRPLGLVVVGDVALDPWRAAAFVCYPGKGFGLQAGQGDRRAALV